MARRPSSLTEEDFESLEGRASKTEQKKAVQRMAALGAQLAELSAKQIKNLPVEERLIEALLDVQQISSHEARRQPHPLRRNRRLDENETVILSYLTPKQGLKKTAQLQRWVDRIVKDGDPAINEFTKTYNATERHTLRQHYLRVHRDLKNQAPEEEVTASKLKLFNYVQQVALISDN